MADGYDKILHSSFTRERIGLIWVEAREQDEEKTEWHSIWLLVDPSTDCVLASIDGPYRGQICYSVATEQAHNRLYISLDGAKRAAFALAAQIISDRRINSARSRKQRRHGPITPI